MKQPTVWLYYACLLGLFCLLKVAYIQASSTDLYMLLAPTNYLVELTLGSTSVFEPTVGFVHPSLHISIDKSCSGFNFWAMCWLMLSVAAVQQRLRLLLPVLLALPLVSYALALLINTSRILTAILLRRMLPSTQHYEWLHQAEGAVLYLFSLVLIYLGFVAMCSYLHTRYAPSA
ncbi:exosortase K [Hymenobacter crusticola]|uniref:Exosortase K n=1 Tax=Hymenobacter crusticola TaxID=1770526 RepID=A0A243WDK8_9BACT|nr:exosortase K [Hymenobacter crusticola]OUJ72908.1 exosortase K [Hymenobacter crusticola]